MTTYKGTDKNMQCRGFQYEVGKDYETGEAKACQKGFHACENPLDVFGYYPPADSRYFEVEQSGELDRDGEDSKVASTKIHISAEVGLTGVIKAGVKFILDRVDFKSAKESNTGYQSAATNTGNRSAATNTGYQSAATNTGNQSAATVTGRDAVAHADGYDGKARGALGCAITVVERGPWNGMTYPLIGAAAAIVDGKTIKADTYYKLVDGQLVEAE